MAKSRTLNEIRQSKEYQTALQGGDFIKPTDKPAKSTAEVMSKNPFEHAEVDETVDQIAEDLQPVIYDTIFELICNEMSTKHVFDSSEYLTEAGLELFEDEWFEFYHENHGKIMHKLMLYYKT